MTQTTTLDSHSLPREMWHEVIAPLLPYQDLVHLIMTNTSFSELKDDCFWEWRNRLTYPCSKYEASTAFEKFRHDQTIQNNIRNNNYQESAFPCLRSIEDSVPSAIHASENYIISGSYNGLLEWFDPTTHVKLGEINLRQGSTANDRAYKIIEQNGLFPIITCGGGGSKLVIVCPKTSKILFRTEPMPQKIGGISWKVSANFIYCMNDRYSLRKFDLNDLSSVQEIQLNSPKKEINHFIQDFSINKDILCAYIGPYDKRPARIEAYSLDSKETSPSIELSPLYEILSEDLPQTYSPSILDGRFLHLFKNDGVSEKWEIDFDQRCMNRMYSKTNPILYSEHFVEGDYIYSYLRPQEKNPCISIYSAHTGEKLGNIKTPYMTCNAGGTPLMTPRIGCITSICSNTNILGSAENSIKVFNFNVPPKKENIIPQIHAFCDEVISKVEDVSAAAKDFFEGAPKDANEKCVIQ